MADLTLVKYLTAALTKDTDSAESKALVRLRITEILDAGPPMIPRIRIVELLEALKAEAGLAALRYREGYRNAITYVEEALKND